MRKSFALLLAAAVGVLVPVVHSLGQRGVQGPGTRIEVTVFDAVTMRRLPAARVSVRDLSERPVRQSVTGSSGESAMLTGIPAGRYYLYADHGGHVPSYYGERGGEGFRSEILVEAPGELRYEITLNRAGTVSGSVLDVNRRPLDSAEVALMTIQYSALGERFLAIPTNIPVFRTGRGGSYRFTGIPPGEYYVRAVPTDDSRGRRIANHSLRTYYPGVSSPEQAVPIVIPKEGGDSPGTNFGFSTGSQVKVAGTIIYPPQTPGEAAAEPPDRFYLVPRDSRYASLVDPAGSLPDQNIERDAFELKNIPRGSYDLFIGSTTDFEVTSAGTTVKLGYTGHAIVNVADRDVTNVRIYLDPGIDLKGQFKLDAAAQALKSNIGGSQPMFIPLDGKPAVFAPGARVDFRSFVKLDGSFELQHAASGEYRVIVAGPRELYLKGAWLGPQNVLGLPFILDRRIADPLILELGGDGSRYEASVLDGNNRPVANARVVLIPQANLRDDPTAYKAAFTSPEGFFEIPGIRPGNYTAFAFREIPERAWANEPYMSPYRNSGISLTFPGSAVVHQNLRVIDKR